jgi:hypothetical protein
MMEVQNETCEMQENGGTHVLRTHASLEDLKEAVRRAHPHGRKARLFIAEFRKNLVKIGRRACAPRGCPLMAHDPKPFPQSREMRCQLGILALADGGLN